MLRYALGILSIPWIPAATDWPLLGLFLLLLLLALGHPVTRPWSLLFLGMLWAGFYGHRGLEYRFPETLAKTDWVVEGEVTGLPERRGRVYRFELRVDRLAPLDAVDPPRRPPRRLRLNWYQSGVSPRPGERWRLRVRLKPPHGFANPGTFDYEHWLFSRGIDAVGYVRRSSRNLRQEGAPAVSVDRWRWQLGERLRAEVPGPSGALIRALAVGDKRDLDDEQWRVLRETGTLHLMVISGLHIGLVAGLGLLLGRGVASLRPGGGGQLAWQAGGGVTLALVYAALAGFSLPTQRAVVMVAVLLAGRWLAREVGGARRWWLALALVLTLDPLAPWSAGFWLSFVAVALLLSLGISGDDQGRWRRALTARGVLLVGLAPWLLFFFQQVSWVAPLANLVAIPLVGLLGVPAILLGTLGVALDLPGAGVLLEGASVLLSALWWGLARLSELPGLPLSPGRTGLVGMALAALAIGLLLQARRSVGLWVPLMLLLPLYWPEPAKPRPGAFQAEVLDVGQGLAVLVETANHRLLYDTGGRWGESGSAAQTVILPYLRARGITRLDALVVSHADQDHAGGVAPILRELEVEMLITSADQLASPHLEALPCLSGVVWHWDAVTFRILHPRRGVGGDRNARSCVLQVSNGAPGLLLTGDIPSEVELQLIGREREAVAAGALVASHHGSGDANSAPWLEAVAPRWLLVSAGYHNRYRHPAGRVVARAVRRGIQVHSTAGEGALKVVFDGSGQGTLSSWRTAWMPYWRAAGHRSIGASGPL